MGSASPVRYSIRNSLISGSPSFIQPSHRLALFSLGDGVVLCVV